MTPEQIEELAPALGRFLDRFLFCCGDTRTFDHLGVYCRGLLSDLARKSVEPIALAGGVAVRTLQEFLRDHVWQQDEVRSLLQRHVAQRLGEQPADDLGVVGIIDETGTPKKGTKTPGVQRQWCGHTGKIDNCIVTVHLGVARGRYKNLIDAELFLPQAWASDRDRCRQAGIPDAVGYRPKWRIALEQLDRTSAQGVSLDWLTFDEYYGSKPEFLDDLDRRPGYYIGEAPCSFSCRAVPPRGRRPAGGWSGQRADRLVRFSPLFRQPWQRVRLTRQTEGPQEWDVKAAQVFAVRGRQVTPRRYWLMVARQAATGERKYFVSNAPANLSLTKLLRVAFQRWNVEHVFRVCKSELGLGHYEGRNYHGLLRHLILCVLTMTFVADQTERLRGEKSGGDAGTDLPRFEHELLELAGGRPWNNATGAYVGDHMVSPAPQSRGPRIKNKTNQTREKSAVAL
jgi:SRSO17 transposase